MYHHTQEHHFKPYPVKYFQLKPLQSLLTFGKQLWICKTWNLKLTLNSTQPSSTLACLLFTPVNCSSMISTIWYYFESSFSVSPFLTFPRIIMAYLTINFSSAVSTKYLWLELCSKVCNGKKGTEEMKTNFLNSLGKRARKKRPTYPAPNYKLVFFFYSITLYVILNQLNKLTSKQGALIKVPLFWKSAGQSHWKSQSCETPEILHLSFSLNYC